MREIKFSFMWQCQKTGEWMELFYTLDEIISGKPYDDMSDNALLSRYHHKHTRQFIGLKDKNGKEIYEGDVVAFDEEGLHEVVWDEKDAGFMYDDRKEGPEYGGEIGVSDEDTTLTDCEIIGNIYENPELMENRDG